MTIVRKIPWTRQPPPGTPIDWSNPLAKDLLFFAPMDYNGTDAVSGEGATLGSTGPESNIRQTGPHGSWCFDTVGGHGDVSDNGWYYGTGIKNDTWPRGFVNRAQGKPGCTTMSFANIDNAIAWSCLFGTCQQGSPYYDHAALVQQNTTGQWAMQWYWSEGNSDDAGSAGISSILTDGKFHQYAQTIRAGSSGSIGTVYRDGQELGNYGPFGSSNGYFDCDTATDKGIVVHSYAPSVGNDTIGALSYGNAMWARELSATEIKAMYENPWQIFQPRTQIIPTFVPAAQTYGVVPRKVPWTKQPTTRTQLDYSHPFKPIQAIVPGWDHVKDAAGQVNSVGKQRLIYSAAENGSVDAGTHLDVKAESYRRWGSFNCWHHDFVSGDAGAGYVLERSEPGDTGIQFADTNNFCVVGIYRPKGDGTVGSSDPRIYSKDEGAFEADHDLMIGTTAGTGGERPRCRIRIGSSTITSAVSAGNIVDNDSWNIILGGVEPHPTAGDVNVITKCIKESNGTVVPNYKSSIQQTGTYNPRTTTSEALFGNAEATTNELDGRILGVFFFDKMLSDEELAAFFQNPWQIFQPQTQYLPTAFDTPTETFGYIPRKVPWTRQPPGGVQINKGNPLTRGLVSAITPAGGSWYDIVANRHGSLQSGATVSAGPLGRWTDFDGSDDAVDMGGDYTDVVDLESNNGQWTALTLIDHDASNGNLWGIRDASVTAQLYTDAGTGGAGSELNYRALSTVNILSAGNLSSGYHTVAVSRDGSTIVKGYIDGIDDGGSGSRVPGNPDTPTANLQLGNHEGSYPYNGAIYLQAFWSRVLSDSEHAELAANPWQIFKPQTQYIPVSFGAAAPPPGDDIIIQIPVWWR